LLVVAVVELSLLTHKPVVIGRKGNPDTNNLRRCLATGTTFRTDLNRQIIEFIATGVYAKIP
jgi:hypothetical protein